MYVTFHVDLDFSYCCLQSNRQFPQRICCSLAEVYLNRPKSGFFCNWLSGDGLFVTLFFFVYQALWKVVDRITAIRMTGERRLIQMRLSPRAYSFPHLKNSFHACYGMELSQGLHSIFVG